MFILEALKIAFFMFWQVLWSLALGFLLSAVVQVVISKRAIVRALGQDSPRSVVVASAFGIASSSCSYAAVAIARSLFRRERRWPTRSSLSSPRPTWSSSWA